MTGLLFVALCVAGLGVVMRFLIIPNASPMPSNLGVKDGKLADCPDKPNCASTQSEPSAYGYTEPVSFTGDAAIAFETALTIVRELPNSTIVTAEAPYLHATTESNFWRFIDDLEIYVDADAGLIHMRSAARLGESDLNANPNRLKAIRQKLQERLPSAETA